MLFDLSVTSGFVEWTCLATVSFVFCHNSCQVTHWTKASFVFPQLAPHLWQLLQNHFSALVEKLSNACLAWLTNTHAWLLSGPSTLGPNELTSPNSRFQDPSFFQQSSSQRPSISSEFTPTMARSNRSKSIFDCNAPID